MPTNGTKANKVLSQLSEDDSLTQKKSADRGVVTFQLYSKETVDGYNATASLAETKNIAKIYSRLAEEAKKNNKEPPLCEVITLLIPNWEKKDNDFNHPEYIEKKKKYLEELQTALKDVPVEVIDFINPEVIDAYELEYLNGLTNYGIIADLMKNKEILRHSHEPHIQMDTNTDILDFEKFYHATIGQDPAYYRDALDVTAYNRFFLTVTNKVGFFAPEGSVGNGGTHFTHYLREAREAFFFSQSPEELLESKKRNAIYEEIFTAALEKAGYVKRVKPQHKLGAIDQFHANVTDASKLPFFGITPEVAVVARQTWLNKDGSASKGSGVERLKSLPPLKYGDSLLISTHISFIIRRHTGNVALTLKEDHKSFLKLVDTKRDIEILVQYYKAIKNKHPAYYLDILRVIPNIEEGKRLLVAMGDEYLSDREKLDEVDRIYDKINDIIGYHDNELELIDLQQLRETCSILQTALSDFYDNNDPNHLSITKLLDELDNILSINEPIDETTVNSFVRSLNAIDDITVDSRLFAIKETLTQKSKHSLINNLQNQDKIAPVSLHAHFKKNITKLKPNEEEEVKSKISKNPRK